MTAALIPITNKIDSAFLFGSVVSGRETNASDIDMMVMGDALLMDVVGALRQAQM